MHACAPRLVPPRAPARSIITHNRTQRAVIARVLTSCSRSRAAPLGFLCSAGRTSQTTTRSRQRLRGSWRVTSDAFRVEPLFRTGAAVVLDRCARLQHTRPNFLVPRQGWHRCANAQNSLVVGLAQVCKRAERISSSMSTVCPLKMYVHVVTDVHPPFSSLASQCSHKLYSQEGGGIPPHKKNARARRRQPRIITSV